MFHVTDYCRDSLGVKAGPITPNCILIPSIVWTSGAQSPKLRYGVMIGFIAAFQNPDWPVDLRLTRREEEL